MPDIPPEEEMLEKGLLGLIIEEGHEGMALAITEGITPAHFSIQQVSHLWVKVVAEYNEGNPIDELALIRKLSHAEMILMNDCSNRAGDGTIVMIPRYLKILKEAYKKREIIKLGHKMIASAGEPMVSAEDLLSYSEGRLLEIGSENTSDSILTVGESLAIAAKNLIDRILGKLNPFIKTGFKKIDDIITGFRAERFYVFAARPGMGKTALGWRIARNIACAGKAVYFLSLEMGHTELSERLISGEIKLNLRHVDQGMMGNQSNKENKVKQIQGVYDELKGIPLTVDDRHDLTLNEIRSRVRHMVAQKRCDVVIIDYIQLIRVESNQKRREQIGEVTRGLKNMSKELKIPVVALCQVNREMEKEKRMPRLSDLRESGDIEQDADVVGMLYRNGEMSDDEVGLVFPKNREGQPDIQTTMGFTGAYTLFEDDAPSKLASRNQHAQAEFGE